jgi:hypothetical protein
MTKKKTTKAEAKERAAIVLHDKAQDVVNEIDRLALVCPPVEALRQALRDYRAALT